MYDRREKYSPHPLERHSARTQVALSGSVHFQSTITSSEFSSFVNSRGGSSYQTGDGRLRPYRFSGTAYNGDAWLPDEGSARAVRSDILGATCDCGIPENKRCQYDYIG